MHRTAERVRLAEDERREKNWKRWGPYLSERQWGTVREDYSADGDALGILPARSGAQPRLSLGRGRPARHLRPRRRLCFALALWNGQDPILKERLFGLTGPEGNHGEDVKELYYYLDATPTHSYLKALYKYPQARVPVRAAVRREPQRTRNEPEFELVDTGVFDENRYFDVIVEYAKASPDDILIAITVSNRGPGSRRSARAADAVVSQHVVVGTLRRRLLGPSGALPRRTPASSRRSTTTLRRHAARTSKARGDAGAAVHGERDERGAAVRVRSPRRRSRRTRSTTTSSAAARRGEPRDARHEGRGALSALAFAGGSVPVTVRARLVPDRRRRGRARSATTFDETFAARKRRGGRVLRAACIPTARHRKSERRRAAGVRRAALVEAVLSLRRAGLAGRRSGAAARRRRSRQPARNRDWPHLYTRDVISMPDKWEYPWFAAWDLGVPHDPVRADRSGVREGAAHSAAARMVHAPERPDPGVRVGAFGDVNPPVHAWACWRVYKMTGARGRARPRVPRARLPEAAHELHLVGESQGRRGQQPVLRRLSRARQHRRLRPLEAAADGGQLEQADGTAWMAFYCRDDALDGARARGARPGVRGHRLEVLRALRRDRRRDEHARRHRPVGRGGRLLLRPAATSTGDAMPLRMRSMVGHHPAVRGRGARRRR